MSISFLQTTKWCEFQKALGADCFNIENTLVVKYKLSFGKNYLYVPRAKTQDIDLNVDNTVFIRVEPEIENSNKDFIGKLKNLGFKKVNQESMPSKTLILDIDESEEELLANMHQKTRYNIRLAEKKEIKIEIVDELNDKEFDRIWILIQNTAKRDKFSSFSKDYYKKLLNVFPYVGDLIPYIKIVLAKYKDEIIAAAIIMFYSDTATYLHGASDYKYRNLMAPYLIQWSAIQGAQKIGCVFYDFWGIDEKKWPGVTRFKKGFSGREVEYVGTWDLVLDKKLYFAYSILKRMQRFLHKFTFYNLKFMNLIIKN